MKLSTILAFSLVAVGMACAGVDETPNEVVRKESSAATCSCPSEDETANCGKWTCSLDRSGAKVCVFAPLLQEREKCLTLGMEKGKCLAVEGNDPQLDPPHFMCCPGCTTVVGRGPYGACRPGNENGYCGEIGDSCEGCGPCETCKEGGCEPTSGNSCGTCKVCSDGDCKDEEPGKACSGGRCAEQAICCTGCLDDDDKCVSGTDHACGAMGAACVDCGQCGTCSGGACDPKTSGACDDGNPCTEGDTCGAEGCAGTPVAVDDGNECTQDSCDANAGIAHVSVAEDTACVGDGTACGTMATWHCTDHDSDAETPRVCKPETGIDCYDGDPCTSDAPDCGMGSCPHDPADNGAPCTQGLRCILNESCQGGVCTGEARNCSDDNPCTIDSCKETDDDPLTDTLTGCTHTPAAMTKTCDDENGCTDMDHCDADGACTGSAQVCEPLDECHGPGSCDPGTGECTDPRLQDGTGCQQTGTCKSGSCKDGTVGTGGAGGSSGAGGTGGSTSGASGNGDSGQGSSTGGDTSSSAGDTGMAGTGDTGSGGSASPGTGGGSGEVGAGGTTGGTLGSGGSGDTGATGGETTGELDGPLYEREPGGCSCTVVGDSRTSGSYLGLGALGVLSLVARRRRRAA